MSAVNWIAKRLLATAWVGLCFFSLPSSAVETGIGVGWHDPHGTELGLNAVFLWDSFGIGLGLGSVSASGQKSGSNLSLSGDVDVMWLITKSTVRPFLRLGLETGGAASSKSGAGVNIGASDPFGGGGLLLVGSKVFGYVGADLNQANDFVPFAGIGLKI